MVVLFHVITMISHAGIAPSSTVAIISIRLALCLGTYIQAHATLPPSFPVFFVFLALTHLPLRKRLVCHLLRLVDLGRVSLGTQRVRQLVCGLGLEVCAVVLVGLSAQTRNISFPVP